MMKYRENAKKNRFLRHISGIFGRKNFFQKVGLRHILGIAIFHLCAKNQQKLMSQSREKLVTGGRTNGRTNGREYGIYSTALSQSDCRYFSC